MKAAPEGDAVDEYALWHGKYDDVETAYWKAGVYSTTKLGNDTSPYILPKLLMTSALALLK
jgi:hypothetical protein